MTLRKTLKHHLWVWGVFIFIFYAVWFWLVFVREEAWQVVESNWRIALAMLFGSYVAGSTPMGGGTVGFPILVLAFGEPASLGRDFSFAIQSIGMTSASLFILCRRQPLAWATMQGALVGSLAGLPIGIFLIAPLVPELWIKVVFAVLWAAFGCLHLYRMREIAAHEGMTDFDERWDFRVGLGVGLLAALTVVPVTGVGIDMMVYALLVLVCRADLKIAVPTTVVVMAFNSVLGVALKAVFTGFPEGLYAKWLAAAPVVALGAPLGALVVSLVGRKRTLLFVSLLCIGQFAWTCHHEYGVLGGAGIGLSIGAVVVLLFVFERLRLWGANLVGERIRRKAM